MLTKYSREIKKLFVGRKEELELLELSWEETLEPEEHHVYVVLNAPGTGKTRLLQYFGERLETQERGLYFHYRCSDRFRTSTELNVDLIKKLLNTIERKELYIIDCLLTKNSNTASRELVNRFEVLKNKMGVLVKEQAISRSEVVSIIEDLSTLFPLFFVADEIQQFQKRILKVAKEDASAEIDFTSSTLVTPTIEETALRYFTRLLSDLMASPVLMVLSGTQYHILTQIGTKIGSPIAGKVRQLLITNFTPEELNEYVTQVNDRIIHGMIPTTASSQASALVRYYQRFLQSFSGGHPRTVVLITERFLLEFSSFLDQNPQYEDFLEKLFSTVESDFKGRIFTREKQDHIRQLQENEYFPIVKEWLLKHATSGLLLGPAPSMSSEAQDHVNDLIYQLMTLGVIVRNGTNQYHITSFFHLLAFLECFTSLHAQFLRQVFTNRFFKLLCGGHAGFGYTFEHVFISAMVIKSHDIQRVPRASKEVARNERLRDVLSSLMKIQHVEVVTGDVNWKTFKMKPHILYHAPQTRAIDLFISSYDSLILIQLTTTKQHQREKIQRFSDTTEKIREKVPRELNVVGWYISLFPINERDKTLASPRVLITAGNELKFILGESLVERLMTIKDQITP